LTFALSKRSLARLEGVHGDLVEVVKRAILITPVDFAVTEGLRTIDRQRQLFRAGASKTMRSRHLTGHAVDLAAWVGGTVRWDWPLYPLIATAMKQAALETGVDLTWGGDWPKFRDGPHFELTWASYPL
jgi:peptidoglycan L-alanyl-D-glutamate endopeptidase CwlK